MARTRGSGCSTATGSVGMSHGRKRPRLIGPITLGAKRAGKPGAGEPHAGFDEAGAGDVTMVE